METNYNPFFEVIDGTFIKCKGAYKESLLSVGNEYVEMDITDGITKIGCLAFKGNNSLQYLYIGKNIIDIGEEAFSCCPNLEKITVDEDNPRYTSLNGSNCIVDKETNCLILGCSTTKIPDSISSIGPYAFCGQTKLIEIEIPSSVKKLHSFAFDGCTSLQVIKMNEGQEEIEEFCFNGCEKLETVYIPKTLRKVDDSAFGVYCDGDGMFLEGDYSIHEVFYSGTKQELPEKVNHLFFLNDGYSHTNMIIHCLDGDISWDYSEE